MKKTLTLIMAFWAFCQASGQNTNTFHVGSTDTLAVFAGDTLAIFGDMQNEGVISINQGGVVLFLGENWQNTSNASIIGTGKVIFNNQNVVQKIEGGSFPILVLNNPNDVVLINNDAAVRDTLLFINGHIVLNNNDLYLGNASRNIELLGYDQNRFIVTNNPLSQNKGFVRQFASINNELIYPIGINTNNYTPCAATLQTNQNDTISIRVFDNMYADATSGTLLNDISVGKTWQFKTASTGSKIQLKMQHNIDNEGNKYNKNYQYVAHYQNAEWNKVAYSQMLPNSNPGTLTSGAPIADAYIATRVFDNLSQNVYFTKITYQNNAPLANNDINIVYQNNTATGNVLTNDFDTDNQALSINTTPIIAPSHGSVTLNTDGSYTYVPIQDFIGKDYFTYQVCDNGVPNLCDTATVALCVTEPVENVSDVLPLASNDNFLIPFAPHTFELNIIANDLPEVGDSISSPIILSTQGVQGTISVNSQGNVLYTPPANFVDKETFQYYIKSHGAIVKYDTAIVTILLYQFEGKNYPPIAVDDALLVPRNIPTKGNVSTNDFDIDINDDLTYTQTSNPTKGTVQFEADGTFIYTPNPSFIGADHFTYKVCDNGDPQQCSEATVYLLIQQLKTECKVKICAPVTIKRRVK